MTSVTVHSSTRQKQVLAKVPKEDIITLIVFGKSIVGKHYTVWRQLVSGCAVTYYGIE